MTPLSRATQTAALNDAFRKHPTIGGRVFSTVGVASEGPEFVARTLAVVAAFDSFTPDNDPYGEHDFGSFELDGKTLFWKIDYYCKGNLALGSEDPGDPAKTERVLTIMLAEEY